MSHNEDQLLDEISSDEEIEQKDILVDKDKPYFILRQLGLLYGCKIKFVQNKLIISDISSGVNPEHIMMQLQTIFMNYDSFLDRISVDLNTHIHIFIDISNLISSCQILKNKDGKQYRNLNLRLNYGKFNDIICGFRHPRSKYAYGSCYKDNDNKLYKKWEELGYYVRLEERHYSDETKTSNEMFVDAALVAEIQNVILQCQPKLINNIRKLIIVTGDGNLNSRQANFRDTVRNGLNWGWAIELWAWENTCSDWYKKLSNISNYVSKKKKENPLFEHSKLTYMGIEAKYVDNFELKYIDPYRDQVVFDITE